MTRLFSLLIALAFSLGQPAMAQESSATGTDDANTATPAPADDTTATPAAPADTDATETPGTDTTEATPKPGATLDMGADPDAPDQPDVGQAYTKAEFGDWQLQCVKTEDGSDPCQLYQLVRDEDDNPVAEFSLFRLPEGGQAVAGATVVVPLETALTEDLLIGVDTAKGKRYRFSFCSPVGCFARIGLTQADIDSMKRGSEASMTIVPWTAPDVKVRLTMSLMGFTAGYEQVTQAAPQQR